jgi:hypothetical protein
MTKRKSFEIYNLTSNMTEKYGKNRKKQFRGYALGYRKLSSGISYPIPITAILYTKCLLN